MSREGREMNNQETAAWLREWVREGHLTFSWPTDGCGYEQHIKFVNHRNANWHGAKQNFNQFVLDYADRLELDDQPHEL